MGGEPEGREESADREMPAILEAAMTDKGGESTGNSSLISIANNRATKSTTRV